MAFHTCQMGVMRRAIELEDESSFPQSLQLEQTLWVILTKII